MEKPLTFGDLNVGDRFDFIPDGPLRASFHRRCIKASSRKYVDDAGFAHTVGTAKARVYHVERFRPGERPRPWPGAYCAVQMQADRTIAAVFVIRELHHAPVIRTFPDMASAYAFCHPAP